MNDSLDETWELVNDPAYKYAVGELAAALLIATKALDEVAVKKTFMSRLNNNGMVANNALKNISTMLGDRMTMLDVLADDYFHLRLSADPITTNSPTTDT